jgi:hypothetical protein
MGRPKKKKKKKKKKKVHYQKETHTKPHKKERSSFLFLPNKSTHYSAFKKEVLSNPTV